MRWFEKDTLRFAVGVEDTFIPQTPFGERPVDEYEMTQHYHFWHADLGLAREAGADMIRWGIPWYRVEPERGRFDWGWLDRVAERFAELELEPMVDLMHYGTPTWLENEFVNAAYPQAVADYAHAVAERYRGVMDVFTPLNEPVLNIMYCGEFGHWPPYLRGDDGFVQLLRAVSKGIVLTQEAVAAANPDASFVHVEMSFRTAGELARSAEAEHLRRRAFLVEDLVTGRVDAAHPLVPWLSRNGFRDDDLAWAAEHTAQPDVMGVNYYPALSTELFRTGDRHTGGPLDPRPRLDEGTAGLADVLTTFAERYQRPVFLTETCLTGSYEERIGWLDASMACVHALREQGVPVIGYTWWSLIDMYEWPYRTSTKDLDHYQLPMGLWDLVRDSAGVLQRVRNPVADRFAHHARQGAVV